jgi:hypothetical protein
MAFVRIAANSLADGPVVTAVGAADGAGVGTGGAVVTGALRAGVGVVVGAADGSGVGVVLLDTTELGAGSTTLLAVLCDLPPPQPARRGNNSSAAMATRHRIAC